MSTLGPHSSSSSPLFSPFFVSSFPSSSESLSFHSSSFSSSPSWKSPADPRTLLQIARSIARCGWRDDGDLARRLSQSHAHAADAFVFSGTSVSLRHAPSFQSWSDRVQRDAAELDRRAIESARDHGLLPHQSKANYVLSLARRSFGPLSRRGWCWLQCKLIVSSRPTLRRSTTRWRTTGSPSSR